MLNKTHYVNNKKVVQEFTKFISEIKNVLPYQQYTQLLKKSNNFNNLDDKDFVYVDVEDEDLEISYCRKIEDNQFFYAEVFAKRRKNAYLEATMALTAPMDSSNIF